MWSLLSITADVFFSPAAGMAKAAEIKWKKALFFLFFLLLLLYWPLARKMLPNAGGGVLLLMFSLKFFMNCVALFLYSAIVHGLAGVLFGAAGDIRKLLASFSFTYLPFALLSPLSLLAVLKSSVFLQAALVFVLFFWMGCLAAFGAKAVYNVNNFQANVVVSLPTFIFLFAFAAFIFYLGVFIGNFLPL